ncbi:amino acid adenylation domain-containing protein [Lysinibacillus sp. M3]|uniref:Amino acid adenylation domain-containing protein n=1 Tax=Lysinibacillus zambalensis TaxID=3160866 RepID=A0ABV1MUT4_9BACI
MKQEQIVKERPFHLVILSARSEDALRQAVLQLGKHLEKNPNQSIGDLAFTLGIGRKSFEHRLSLVVSSVEELKDLCYKVVEQTWDELQHHFFIDYNQYLASQPSQVSFSFSDKGTPCQGMGLELYDSSSVFRAAIDECSSILDAFVPVPFTHYFFDPIFESEFKQTKIRTAALFTLQYALARLYISWGINPTYVSDSELGKEIVACITGFKRLDHALRSIFEMNDFVSHNNRVSEVKDNLNREDIQRSIDVQYLELDMDFILGEAVKLEKAIHSKREQDDSSDILFQTISQWRILLRMLGRLYTQGVKVDWKSFDRDFARMRVHAPTYPFQRKYYWITDNIELIPNFSIASKEASVTTDVIEASNSKITYANHSTEEIVRLIWENLLGRKEIQDHDNFLSLGGDSLTMIQVKSQISSILKLDISIKELFKYPTFKDFVIYLENVRGDKSEREIGFPRAEEKEWYPLSHSQRRLWFLYQVDPHSSAYNVPLHFRLKGLVKPDLLREALHYLMERHTALRTIFKEVNGEAFQKVCEHPALSLQYQDLSNKNVDEQLEIIQKRIHHDQVEPFDLTKGPNFRVILFKCDDQNYHFYFNQHHILTDGWSMDVLMEELANVYMALAESKTPNLKKPVQFIDYIEWFDNAMNAGKWEREREYWLNDLAKPLPNLDLPIDFQRPEIQTFEGRVRKLQLPKELIFAIRYIATQEGVSLYMLMFTAYKILLHYFSQEEDIIVGTPVAGRTEQPLESTIGFFANSVAIRTNVQGHQSIGELLRKVSQKCMDAIEYQSYPFDLLIEEIMPERNLSRTPIFSTFFVYRNSETVKKRTDQLIQFDVTSQSLEDMDATSSKFDLTLNIVSKEEGDLNIFFEYNTALFRDCTVERITEVYRRILEELVRDLNTPIRDLQLMSAEEKLQYESLNQTNRDHPRDRVIPELFYEQVELYPELPAISDDNHILTYLELNQRSNQLAYCLRQRGIEREQVVGILMERSVDAVIAMLAVLKAGGAFVPIDPNYPEQRVRYMIEDSQASLLLTKRRNLDELGLEQTEHILFVEEIPSEELPSTNMEVTSRPSDLAYIIYTSGSTGIPKGTELEHIGVMNLVHWKKREYGYAQNDTVLQFASFSFDASIWEIFPTILNGAHLYILNEEERRSPDELINTIHEQKATTITVPTVFFNQLSRAISEKDLTKLVSLKRIFVAGEALKGEVVRNWQKLVGQNITIINAYGPTETTVCATVYPIDHIVSEEQTYIPIGRPIDNTRAYILKEDLSPCPMNVVGELFIESIALARGYRNQEEKTKQAFIVHPFSTNEEVRLYRTGDMVRLLPEGNLEYIGRKDDQIKIRGHRVEIGEIEECLMKHPAVKEGAVIAIQLLNDLYQLYAFVTTMDASSKLEDIRGFVATYLPDYMVPMYMTQLDQMPLTPNGKIDYKQLQKLEVVDSTTQYKEPAREIEKIIQGIWIKCLGNKRIGITDNFFSVGGDSILSMQVISFLQQAGYIVKVQDLFQHQTIEELATFIESTGVRVEKKSEREESVVGEVPLAPIQHWLFNSRDVNSEYYFMPIAVDIHVPIDIEHLRKTLQILINHHDMLRAIYVEEDGETAKQYILPPEEVQLQLVVHDLSSLSEMQSKKETERIESVMKESIRFEKGILMKAALIKYSPNNHRFLWVLHHLVVDVVSLHVLNMNLVQVYESLQEGLDPLNLRKTSSYKTWVETVTKQINGFEGEKALLYWTPILKEDTSIPIPLDHPEGSNHIGDRFMLKVFIEQDKTTKLLTDITTSQGTSIKEILLTLVMRAVAKWSGNQKVGLSIEGHGRESIDKKASLDLTQSVGWFTSIYPFYADIPHNQEVGDTIQHISRNLAEVPHQGASFGMLRYLHEDPTIKKMCNDFNMPEVSYNFMGQPTYLQSNSEKWTAGQQYVLNNSPESVRPFEVQIVGSISHGQLMMSFEFSEHRHQKETAEKLSKLFVQETEELLSSYTKNSNKIGGNR